MPARASAGCAPSQENGVSCGELIVQLKKLAYPEQDVLPSIRWDGVLVLQSQQRRLYHAHMRHYESGAGAQGQGTPLARVLESCRLLQGQIVITGGENRSTDTECEPPSHAAARTRASHELRRYWCCLRVLVLQSLRGRCTW
jgi:hypothetical protein